MRKSSSAHLPLAHPPSGWGYAHCLNHQPVGIKAGEGGLSQPPVGKHPEGPKGKVHKDLPLCTKSDTLETGMTLPCNPTPPCGPTLLCGPCSYALPCCRCSTLPCGPTTSTINRERAHVACPASPPCCPHQFSFPRKTAKNTSASLSPQLKRMS